MKISTQPHVLIIGAGFAGMQAAQTLSRRDVRVTLVDRNNYHLFQPLLYQVASTGLNPSEISAVIRRNFRKSKNVRMVMATLTGLDKAARVAVFDDGQLRLEYDYLILAVGGKTSYFGNDDWEPIAPGLKTLHDAVTIRNRLLRSLEEAERRDEDGEELESLTSVVVIGGGPTGVELAGAFAELRSKVLGRDFRSFDARQIKVTLVEGGGALLGGYDKKSSDYTKKRLEKLGVTVLLNERVTAIDESGVTTSERFLASRNVVWAAGVEGHPLARLVTDKVDNRNRILVTPELLVEGEDVIYACGDMTYFGHDERYPRGLPGVAPTASQQGTRAAKNILARIQNKEQKPFRYFDKGKMATIGRSAAVAETKRLRMRGLSAWLAWLFIHLIYLVEFQDRILVFTRWVWSYLTWNWGVRIIFGGTDSGVAQAIGAPPPEGGDESTEGEVETPSSDGVAAVPAEEAAAPAEEAAVPAEEAAAPADEPEDAGEAETVTSESRER